MSAPMLGMNPDEVEELGRLLQSHAERLRSLVSQITGNVMSTGWVGPDATRFTHEWWPATRAQIIACAEDLHGFGQSALNNAAEQRRASGVLGEQVPISTPNGTAMQRSDSGDPLTQLSTRIAQIDTVSSWASLLTSVYGESRNLPGLRRLGDALAVPGYMVDVYDVVNTFVSGDRTGAAVGAALLGGDIAADSFKRTGTPLGYGLGVATQSWVEVGRAAREVDWSSDGLQHITSASLGDWADAFGEASMQLPTKLWKIFGW
ncbi:WXG100 family type VII secretion target [Rhabdothermincola sediminis]|uniref:WXG100 family type VII secretion target n=1 Tax=Rhabdothermincola sediminis TaxID=2751370 RepID=UPI001AA055B2|nr:hypothetical protein [Rhabdothermincola sediminis]